MKPKIEQTYPENLESLQEFRLDRISSDFLPESLSQGQLGLIMTAHLIDFIILMIPIEALVSIHLYDS